VTFAKPLGPSLGAGTEGYAFPRTSPTAGHDPATRRTQGPAQLRVDTRRGLQPKAKVEPLAPHFERKVPHLAGVIELALPCAGLCDHAGRHGIGLRTETDQFVGPLIDTTIVVHLSAPWWPARSLGSRQTPRSLCLSISLASPHQTR
jgi:hypothetical protein